MKLGEIYQIYFDSQANNMISSPDDKSNMTYKVNWSAILPQKYKQYHCKAIFKSESFAPNENENVTQSGFVSANFGKTNVFDGYNTNSNKVAFIFPRSYYSDTVCYTNDGFDDDNIFTIQRPVNDTVTVTIRQSANSKNKINNMPHYLLVLNLQGIVEM